MKRTIGLTGAGWLMVLLVAALAAAQQRLWVTASGAQLKAQRGATADTVAQLPVGSELTVNAYQRRWYQVTTADGATGWIYRGKVAAQPPAATTAGDNAGSVGDLLGGMSGDSAIQVSSAGTARSVRGLSPEAQQYAQKAKTPEIYQQALDRVLSIKATDPQINWFLKTEKIGEYAE